MLKILSIVDADWERLLAEGMTDGRRKGKKLKRGGKVEGEYSGS